MQPAPIPENEPARLRALERYRILDTPAEPSFDALTRITARVLQVPIALISLVDSGRQWFKSRYGLEVAETPRDISFCGHVVAQERPLVVCDATRDSRFADNPLVTGSPGVRSYAGFPLRTSDDYFLGTICAIDTNPRTFDPDALEIVDLLAKQTMDQLELRRQARLAAEEGAQLEGILETASDAIIVIDPTGRILRCNTAAEAMFGHRREELLAGNVRMIMPEDLRARHDRGIAAYLATGQRKVIGIGRELLGLRRDGTTLPVDAAVSEVRVGEERLFTGVLRDATDRKEAARAIQETLADLERSRNDLVLVLDRLQVGALVVGADLEISFANEACLRICGMEGPPGPGLTWEALLDASPAHVEAIRKARALPAPERHRLVLRLGVSRPRPRWVELDLQDDPRDAEGLIFLLYDVSDVHELRERLRRQRGRQLLGESAAMHALYELIERVASGDWTVLVEGETGTGKELVARAIHAASERRAGPFVAVNCAGLTESLLGSQLFGHVKGAFTGATATQPGLFEAATGGTLFLDEIGDMSLPLQASLLRVLQEKEITRIGETLPRKVDVRIVAATNRRLQERVAAGAFREDLLYRVRGARVHVPPLRERRDDIALLVTSFLAQQRLAAGRPFLTVAPDALRRLVAYDWPGNVRELRTAVEHAVVRCRGRQILQSDLPPEIQGASAPAAPAPVVADERGRLVDALKRTGGNRAKAARLLGIGRATLYRRLKALGIEDRGEEEDARP